MSKSKKLNVDDITRGAMAVLISQVLPKEEQGCLTAVQTAAYLNMSVTQLNFIRHNNKGPDFYRDDSGKVFYTPSAIKQFIDEINAKSKSKRRAA